MNASCKAIFAFARAVSFTAFASAIASFSKSDFAIVVLPKLFFGNKII
jgi:hypothetical protein